MMLDVLFQFDGSRLATWALTILAGSTLKVTVLLIAAVAAVAALRGASAARRHLVWSVAAAATLAMPVLSAAMPDLAVPGLELRLGDAGPETSDDYTIADPPAEDPLDPAAEVPLAEPAAEDPPAEDPLADPGAIRDAVYERVGIAEREWKEGLGLRTDALETRTGSLESRVTGLEDRVAALEARPAPAGPAPSGDGDRIDGVLAAAAAGPDRPSSNGGPGIAAALLAIWAAGFLAVLGTLAIGMLRLVWLRRRATRIVAGPVAETADRVASRLGLTRRPILLQGDDTAMPMTWGLSRAIVLLPAGAEAWDAWRLEAVLLHELAHVARRDYAAQVVADAACALYWFHPLVWIAAHRLRVEREHACDDVVVSAGTDAPAYAHGLLEIARTLRVGPAAARAALGMARPNHFRERLLALLDERRDRSPLTRRRAASTGALGLALVLPLAALGPASGQASARVGEEAKPDPVSQVAISASSEAKDAASPETKDAALPDPVAEVAASASASAAADARAEPWAAAAEVSVQQASAQEATALCGPADGELTRVTHSTNDHRILIATEYGRCETSARIEGDIRFSDDLRSIAGLSGDAFLRLEVNRDGDRRRMEVRPGSGGRPEYRWWVDGQEHPFDEAAERWLESALLDLFRTTGYRAKERVALILRQEGPDGVLVEATRMRGDYPRAIYLQELLEQARLSPEQVRNVIEIGARGIESDHWLARILKAAAERHTFDAPTRTAFIRAAGSLDSDHHQADVLSTALAREDLSREDLTILLEQVAGGIESDHHVANILTQLARRYSLEPALREPFLRAAATLDSDHHRANVYGTLLARRDLRPEELAAILGAAGEIDSDHHLANLLAAATEHDLSDATLRGAFLDAAGSIESAHHQANVYSAALRLEGLSSEELAAILAAAREIRSDHHLAQILMEVSERGLTDPALQRAYLDAAGGVDSDHHRARVLTALIDRDDVPAGELVLALRAAREIDSDHHLSELLLRVASRHALEGEIRDEFLRALDGIESDHHHGRVASRVMRNGR